jgi:hypothetical protein
MRRCLLWRRGRCNLELRKLEVKQMSNLRSRELSKSIVGYEADRATYRIVRHPSAGGL